MTLLCYLLKKLFCVICLPPISSALFLSGATTLSLAVSLMAVLKVSSSPSCSRLASTNQGGLNGDFLMWIEMCVLRLVARDVCTTAYGYKCMYFGCWLEMYVLRLMARDVCTSVGWLEVRVLLLLDRDVCTSSVG